MSAPVVPGRSHAEPPAGIALRTASADDIPACGAIWRAALNDYMARLSLPPIPDELGAIGRLHGHARETDPDRFVVATRGGPQEPERIVGFVSALVRDGVWFLSMLFVLPVEQGQGLGRALLERVLPGADDDLTLATGTDSVQPISNALYSSYGIVPRMPLFSLVGRPARDDSFAPLPSGISAVPFEQIASGPPGGDGHRRLVDAVERLDRAAAGLTHPQDHRFLRLDSRRGFLYEGPDGSVLAYGYTSEVGRTGPIAVADEALLEPILGHLLTVVEPRGPSAVWIPGQADRALVPLLRAGFRLDNFPVLLCWSRPFGDFRRYLPISPGML